MIQSTDFKGRVLEIFGYYAKDLYSMHKTYLRNTLESHCKYPSEILVYV